MAKRRRKPRNLYDLDIVIPVYGRADFLGKCLDALDSATFAEIKARIIIVDDQGPDQEALDILYQSLNGKARLVRNSQNLGFPATVNAGVKAGNAPLILILNTDVELQPGAIIAMVDEFKDPQVGVVGPKLLFPPDGSSPYGPAGTIQHAGLAVRFNGEIAHANIGWGADHPKVNERREMQAVTGACLMTRRSVWRGVIELYQQAGDPSGAMNVVYSPGTYEDAEYCLAARSLDYKVVYQPAAVAYHSVGGSSADIGGGYPLSRNEMIFRARCGGMLAWDEWRYT